MKTGGLILSLLTAAAVASGSLFGGSSQNALVDEPAFPVPGKNPLNVRVGSRCCNKLGADDKC
jgi:hypothetical protein